jgi:hypothetical protein
MAGLPRWLRNREEREELARNEVFRGLAEYDPDRARSLVEGLRAKDDPAVEAFDEIIQRVEARTEQLLGRAESHDQHGAV